MRLLKLAFNSRRTISLDKMCSRYTVKKNEAKIRLREKIEVFGCVPRGDIRPTDLAPVILPDEAGFSCREMRWAGVCRGINRRD